MNTNILQKCVDELKKDTFSKEYVLGMLETLIVMSSDKKVQVTYDTKTNPVRTEHVADEEAVPDFLKPGPVGNIVG